MVTGHELAYSESWFLKGVLNTPPLRAPIPPPPLVRHLRGDLLTPAPGQELRPGGQSLSALVENHLSGCYKYKKKIERKSGVDFRVVCVFGEGRQVTDP